MKDEWAEMVYRHERWRAELELKIAMETHALAMELDYEGNAESAKRDARTARERIKVNRRLERKAT